MRTFAALLVPLVIFAADKRPIGPVQGGNNSVEVIASAHIDRAEVTRVLGLDPGMDLIVVEVKVVPKDDKKLLISRDDFTLLSNKDGQRSEPMVPSQIAGKNVLVVSSSGAGATRGIGVGQQRGPIWGGAPGTGTRPRRIGGDDDVAGGSISAGETKATVRTGDNSANPLLEKLKERILPEGETAEPVTGLLYFLFDGKHKLKHLDLLYKSAQAGPRVILDFEK